jgi:hypothetical protein
MLLPHLLCRQRRTISLACAGGGAPYNPMMLSMPSSRHLMSAPWHMPATKLYLPLPTTTLVKRSCLLDRLDATQCRSLASVIAPAGFGKTTLVSNWVAYVQAQKVASVAWLTLDAYDDEHQDVVAAHSYTF